MQKRPHVVMKQVIDIAINEQLNARDVQERVSRLVNERLMPLLDKYLDQIDTPGTTTQIPQLEIDLGIIKEAELEELFEYRFEQEISAVASRMGGGSSTNAADMDGAHISSQNQTDRVLVACFLETGTFPWWVNDGSPRRFTEALVNIIKEEKGQALALLQVLFETPYAVKRLVYNADDKLLREIATTAAGNNLTVIKALDELTMQRIFNAYKTSLTSTDFREKWWIDFFTLTLQKPWAKGQKAPQLIQTLLDPLTGFEMQQTDQVNPVTVLPHHREQLWILDKLLNVFAPVAKRYHQDKPWIVEEISNTFTPTGDDILSLIEQIETLQACFNELRATFGIKLVDYPVVSKSSSEGADSRIEAKRIVGNKSITNQKTTEAPANLNKPASNDKVRSDNESKDRSANKSRAPINNDTRPNNSIPGNLPEEADNHHTNKKNIAEELLANSAFSDIEKLYINNAGLVLLWPFIPRLFKNLLLIVDDEFTDANAAAKACLLLQYLAQGNTDDVFEPALPLNKILTGVDLFEPIDVQIKLTDAERQDADYMLNAVINNAPLWKTLSVDGLRRAYLQREGILSMRDGQWLLQAKRETYDVILDQLPWAIGVVKLPWMDNVIFVEWLST